MSNRNLLPFHVVPIIEFVMTSLSDVSALYTVEFFLTFRIKIFSASAREALRGCEKTLPNTIEREHSNQI